MVKKLILDNDSIRVALLEEYGEDDFQPVMGRDGKPQLSYEGKPVYRVRGVVYLRDTETGRFTVDNTASLRLVEPPVMMPAMVRYEVAGRVVVNPYINDSGKYPTVRYSITAEALIEPKDTEQ